MKNRTFSILVNELNIFLAFSLLFSLLGYLGNYYYIFDVFSQFKLQLLFLNILISVCFILINLHKKQSILIFILCTFLVTINAYEVLPWLKKYNHNTANVTIRLSLLNVLTSNKNYNTVIKSINANKADIVVLQEVNQDWLDNLSVIKHYYPYEISISRDDNFGMALYSKIRLYNSKIVYWDTETPVILSNIIIKNKNIRIAGIHTTPPTNQHYFVNRNAIFQELIKWVKSGNGHTLIIGDLNTTMYSPSYKELISKTNLINTRKGFGIYPSWSTMIPLFFRVPLDHVLSTGDIKTISFKTGKYTGSDHLPIIVDLALKN